MVEQRKMLAAWAVLEDAARSISLAVNADEDHWRVHWAGSLALLRAVGHVLQNVDESRSDAHKKCSKEWWKRWNPTGGTEDEVVQSEEGEIGEQREAERADGDERRRLADRP